MGVEKVVRDRAVRVSELSGTLAPVEEATVSFEVAGRITELLKEEGDRLEAGDELARLDASDYQLQLARAGAGVVQADASLDKVNNGARQQEILQAQAALDKATIAYQRALDDFRRTEQLYKESAVSRLEYDNAHSRLQLAEKDMIAAKQALSLVTEGARPEDRKQTQSAYDMAVISQKQAELALAKTRLRSPISGTVIAKLASPGQLVSPGTPVYRVGNVDSLKVLLPVPDREIHQWKTGDTVTLTLYGSTREGKVTNIFPAANQSTGTISVEVTVPNPNHDWFAGQVVKASRELVGKEGLFVPVGAVISRGEEQPYVFVAADGKAVKTPVTIGEIINNRVEILSGLKEGDEIVTKGVDRLFDGDPIEPAGGSQP